MNEETLKRFQEEYDKKFSHPDNVGSNAYYTKLAIEGRYNLDTPIPEKKVKENCLGLLLFEDLIEQ